MTWLRSSSSPLPTFAGKLGHPWNELMRRGYGERCGYRHSTAHVHTIAPCSYNCSMFMLLILPDCSAMMMANLIEGRDIDEDSAGPGDGALVVSDIQHPP
jgi:hypothetical protein